ERGRVRGAWPRGRAFALGRTAGLRRPRRAAERHARRAAHGARAAEAERALALERRAVAVHAKRRQAGALDGRPVGADVGEVHAAAVPLDDRVQTRHRGARDVQVAARVATELDARPREIDAHRALAVRQHDPVDALVGTGVERTHAENGGHARVPQQLVDLLLRGVAAQDAAV